MDCFGLVGAVLAFGLLSGRWVVAFGMVGSCFRDGMGGSRLKEHWMKGGTPPSLYLPSFTSIYIPPPPPPSLFIVEID